MGMGWDWIVRLKAAMAAIVPPPTTSAPTGQIQTGKKPSPSGAAAGTNGASGPFLVGEIGGEQTVVLGGANKWLRDRTQRCRRHRDLTGRDRCLRARQN